MVDYIQTAAESNNNNRSEVPQFKLSVPPVWQRSDVSSALCNFIFLLFLWKQVLAQS